MNDIELICMPMGFVLCITFGLFSPIFKIRFGLKAIVIFALAIHVINLKLYFFFRRLNFPSNL